MRFDPVRDKAGKLIGIIVAAQKEGEKQLVDFMEGRVWRGFKLGEIQNEKAIMFFYLMEKLEVSDRDFDISVPTKSMSAQEVEVFLMNTHFETKRIDTYGGNQYRHQNDNRSRAIKITISPPQNEQPKKP